MRKTLLSSLALFILAIACNNPTVAPRPTIPLVHAIVADTAGLGRLVASAGHQGVSGSIALIGEPDEVIALARRFQTVDQADNIDGSARRDSLPDFAGEHFDAILDANDAPYTHYLQLPAGLDASADSLRETAVRNALFAWDSTCFASASHLKPGLRKPQAKILIFTSSLQARWGLFDVDTLQQLCGGSSRLLSPTRIMLEDALEAGARNLAVWTSREVRLAGSWEAVFQDLAPEGATLQVLSPDGALDVRTDFRQLLRQYRANASRLDALLLDSYALDPAPLLSELSLIRLDGTEEDASFNKMIAPDLCILDPASSAIRATYRLLRRESLFSHRIARPLIRYYETAESGQGSPVLVEVDASYIHRAYVQDFD